MTREANVPKPMRSPTRANRSASNWADEPQGLTPLFITPSAEDLEPHGPERSVLVSRRRPFERTASVLQPHRCRFVTADPPGLLHALHTIWATHGGCG